MVQIAMPADQTDLLYQVERERISRRRKAGHVDPKVQNRAVLTGPVSPPSGWQYLKNHKRNIKPSKSLIR